MQSFLNLISCILDAGTAVFLLPAEACIEPMAACLKCTLSDVLYQELFQLFLPYST